MMDSQDTRGFLYMLNYVTKKDNDERNERGLESKGVGLRSESNAEGASGAVGGGCGGAQ